MAHALNIPNFVPHGPLFFVSLLCFIFSQCLAPLVAKQLVPDVYNSLSRNNRYAWTVKSVSFIHSTLVAPWALYLTIQSSPMVCEDRVFGWDPRVGTLVSVSAAYFVWDTLEAILSGNDVAFVLHGAACSFIYISGYRPFAVYFGPRALIWELSTPFLNMHWFFDKVGMTGSIWQLVNGLVLVTVFFCVRLVFGMVVSVQFFQTMYVKRHEAPTSLVAFYFIANLILYGLSWFCMVLGLENTRFGKMIAALRKRFPTPEGEPQSIMPIEEKVELDSWSSGSISSGASSADDSSSSEAIDIILGGERPKTPNGETIDVVFRTAVAAIGQHIQSNSPGLL
ncbi:hypothetical protein FRB97_000472 [Tulasnella sp. 331]|nr:hypothetical protein FRB97_000472 [Tulasnella sp. 331]